MALEPGDNVWYYDHMTSQTQGIPQADWFPGFSGPTDYHGHGGEIFEFVVYDDQIVRGQPHMNNHAGSFAWLNNNPGNITGRPGGPDYGQYPGKFNWHNFLIFPDWDTGRAAIAQLLRGPGYASLSILDAFKKYAPAGDGGNDPVKYASDVAAALTVDASTTIVGDLDDDQMMVVQDKIQQIEGAIPGDSFDLDDSTNLPQEIQDLLNS
jgi:hypothetical protein